MVVKGGAKMIFLCVFIKKRMFYSLDVEIILYLCIRKKFTKTGNFPIGEREKVFRFGKLFEREKKCNQLKNRWLLIVKWRIS